MICKPTFALKMAVSAVLLVFLTTVFVAGNSMAQTAAPPGSEKSVTELENLVKTIEDDAERKVLLSQLKALIEIQRKEKSATEQSSGIGARLIAAAASRAKELSEHLTNAAVSVRKVPDLYKAFVVQVADLETRQSWLRLFYKLVLTIIVGYIAHLLTRWLLRRPRGALEGKEIDNFWVRLPFLLLRTLFDLIPVVAFFAAAQAVLPLTEPRDVTRAVVTTFLNAYLIAGFVVVIARMAMVPRVSGLRLLPIADETSNYLFIWARRFTFAWVYGFFLADAGLIIGMGESAHRLFSGVIGLLLLGMAIMFILQNRAQFAEVLRGDGSTDRLPIFSGLRNRLADVWHALTIIYMSGAYAVWLLQIPHGFEFMFRATLLTVLILVIASALAIAVRRAVRKGFSLKEEMKLRYPTLEARANRYLPVLQTTLRWLITIVAALSILSVWGADVPGWLVSPNGRGFVSAGVSIVLVLIIALVIWEGISSAIERYLNRIELDEAEKARRARARTLLPLLRNVLFIVIIIMVGLIVLSEIGINIGPLLAGAGVVGLAIGFGSQKLVQDVITGAFILFEDSLTVGDVVNVAGTSGVVEALSIRSIRLRDLSGNVHTIPFSVVNDVTNMTKDFSHYVFEVGVAYRENVDEVIQVLKELGSEMEADPEYGPLILQPLDVLGVDKFADSAVIIKARYKTIPIKQWMVGREFNRRIKNRFDELGIEIPFPHQTVYFGEDKEGKAPPLYYKESQEPRVSRTLPAKSNQSQTSDGDGGKNSTPSDSGQVGGSDSE